jgi:hypothetical protein
MHGDGRRTWKLDRLSVAAAPRPASPPDARLSVVLSTKREVERETGLEPATFSLEGLGVYA